MHVEEFIDDDIDGNDAPAILHARWFFLLHRFPAMNKEQFRTFIDRYKLFCDYEGQRYRVGGCSRLGDVWLLTDLTSDRDGYDLRVDVEKCSNWSDAP